MEATTDNIDWEVLNAARLHCDEAVKALARCVVERKSQEQIRKAKEVAEEAEEEWLFAIHHAWPAIYLARAVS